MKNLFRLIIVSIFLHSQVYACEICGCGAGSLTQGILPQGGTNFVGVRYRSSAFDSHVLHSASLRTSEHFQTTEFWGRYYLSPSLQIVVTLPYNINSQRTSTQEFIRRGLGDASLTALYSAWVSQPQSSNDTVCSVPAITHALLIGGGLKIPTGSYQFNPYSTTEVANANFQLGTGSWDILISGNYTIRGEVYGAMVDVQARIPTVNSNGYRFGNRAMTTFAGFALLSLSSDIRMMPLVGISSEISMQDIRQNKTVAETGGVTGFALLGTDIYFMNTLSIGCTVSIPVASQMADGEIRPAPRVTIQSAWLW